jgi:hypothetical protein
MVYPNSNSNGDKSNSQTNESNANEQPNVPPIDFTPIQPARIGFVTVSLSNAHFEENEELPSVRGIPVRRVSLMLPNSVDSGQFAYIPEYDSVRGELSSVRQTPNNSQKSTPVVKATPVKAVAPSRKVKVAPSRRNKLTNVQQLQQQKSESHRRYK